MNSKAAHCPVRASGPRSQGVPTACLLVLLASLASAADNLVVNGSFETVDPTSSAHPLAWGSVDGLGIRWADAPPAADGTTSGKAIRFDTAVSEKDMVARWKAQGISEWDIPDPSAGPVGATYGLSLYSLPVAIRPDQPYAIEVRHRGPGGGKVWVRGYSRNGEVAKRIYEAQTEVGTTADWAVISYVFHPTRHTPKVTEVRVMLYAYWPAGESWFDDVRLREATVAELAAEDARRKR